MRLSRYVLIVIVSAAAILVSSITLHAQEQATGLLTRALHVVQQPVTFKQPLVYVGKDGNVYMTDDASGDGQPITGDAGGGPQNTAPFFTRTLLYGQFAWAPTGTMFAFTERANRALTVVESGKPANIVAHGVDSGFPASFSPDGKDIAYVVQTPQQSGPNNQDLVLQIQAVPAAGGSPRALGSMVGTSWACASDVHEPSDMLYFGEMGVLGDSPMTFLWLKQGYLHTMSCTGRGLALSNGAKDIWQNPNLQNAVLSADGAQFLAVAFDPDKKTKQLVLVDLASGNPTPLTTQPNVDRGVFSSDGQTIIYSTVEPGRTVNGNPNSDVGKKLFDTWPVPGNENSILLWSMPLSGGSSALIYKGGGRGIGYLTSARTKTSVDFSLTTSLAQMMDSINAGDPVDKVLQLAPHSEIVAVAFNAYAPPTTVTRGSQPSFGPVDEFAAIPAQIQVASVPTLVPAPTLVIPPTVVPAAPTAVPAVPTAVPAPPTATPAILLPSGGQCPGFLPSRLVIGGKGRVLPGSSNRLRDAPSTGTILLNIPGGGIFDVLEGPICMSNAIAWWRVNYNGTVGWTGEGQGSTYWVEPYTGGPTPVPPSAPSGTFGVVGVPASVSPTTSSACPTTFNFHAQIVVNQAGTVTYRWERSDGATSAVGTSTFPLGVTTIDLSTTWTLSAPGTFWMRLHVLTPSDVTSNEATITLTCGGAAFGVTGVAASVSPTHGSACPTTFNFGATITVNAAGTVTYRWERSDGGTGSTQSLSFGGAGSQSVTTQWINVGVAGTFWERVHILTPNAMYSNQATFTLTC